MPACSDWQAQALALGVGCVRSWLQIPKSDASFIVSFSIGPEHTEGRIASVRGVSASFVHKAIGPLRRPEGHGLREQSLCCSELVLGILQCSCLQRTGKEEVYFLARDCVSSGLLSPASHVNLHPAAARARITQDLDLAALATALKVSVAIPVNILECAQEFLHLLAPR